MSVKASCKICGNSVPSDQFKLHFEYKMMVCPSCYKGKSKPKVENAPKKPEPPKPVGWDQEDEYLAKVAKQRKVDNQAQFSRVPGTNQVRCTCSKCKYQFKYDPFRKMPTSCPYCNEDIPKLRTFNLL
jgi:hypothetical protein